MIKQTIIAMLLVSLAACTTIPETIRTPVAGPDVATARKAPHQFIGDQVRWGGVIVEITTEMDQTHLQVVARQLRNDGSPIPSNTTPGRFMVHVDSELDPTRFKPGRQVTIVGVLDQSINSRIDAHPYTFPLIKSQAVHLWQEVVNDPDYDYYPYYPYYPPYYPYGLHGYGDRYGYGYGHYYY